MHDVTSLYQEKEIQATDLTDLDEDQITKLVVTCLLEDPFTFLQKLRNHISNQTLNRKGNKIVKK